MTTESADDARAALKVFFEAERELTASLAAHAISRPTYLIALQGLRDHLYEKSQLASVMLGMAEDLLDNPGLYLGAEHRKRAGQLGDEYREWLDDFRHVNTERTTFALLDAVAGFTVAPLP